jgi:hypothetical protein
MDNYTAELKATLYNPNDVYLSDGKVREETIKDKVMDHHKRIIFVVALGVGLMYYLNYVEANRPPPTFAF